MTAPHTPDKRPRTRTAPKAANDDGETPTTEAAPEVGAAGIAARATLWDVVPAGEPMLPDSTPLSAIRDSLYDLIPLGALELDLIATPEFVRLQGVKQLGFVYRVWPGATHTRFEHSLGVYYLMLLALRSLRSRQEPISADPMDLRTLLAAALLHDVGHYPFSHAIEELGYPIVPHERIGRQLIEESSIAEMLRRHGIDPARVANLVDPPRGYALPESDALLIRLLSGPLDVDKLDYLPRDARGCNVPYGGVDVTRLLGSLCVLQGSAGPRLGVSDKGISPLNSLLHARQEMFDNVYWHHTNRAMMAMLLRAVQEALESKELAPHDLSGHDDASLLSLLTEARMPQGTRDLVSALRMRRPYKVLIEVSARAGRLFSQLDALFWDQAKRRRVEIALAAALDAALPGCVAPHDVLIDIPKPEKWEMDVLVSFSHPPIGMAPLLTWTEATGQRPSDLGVYEQYQRRIRVVGSETLRAAFGSGTRADAEHILLPVLERIPTL
ncbi:MAG: HD domain-containing protein [Ktedonobacterales bacterium]